MTTTSAAEPNPYRISDAERENFRTLYASGLYTITDLADEFGRSREMIRRVCIGVTRPTLHLTSGIRNEGPRPPQNHVSLPTVLLSQRQRIRGRLWWPGVATNCAHCGGLLLVRPADTDDGEVSCLACSRAVAVVGKERW